MAKMRRRSFFDSDNSSDESETSFSVKIMEANSGPPAYSQPATLPVTQQHLPRMTSINPAKPPPMTSSDLRGQPPRMTSINHGAQPPRMTSLNHAENFMSNSYGTTLRIEENDEVQRQDRDNCCVCTKTTVRRVMYALIIILMMTGITIPLVYLLSGSPKKDELKEPPWCVPREMWGAQQTELQSKPDSFKLVQMVVIQNFITPECYTHEDCSITLRNIQQQYIDTARVDVPYNFFIGGNGLVYEGRGWGKVGLESGRFDECSISIGFVGDYDRIEVQQIQLDRAKLIIETGVGDHYIDPEHVIVGARDITETTSPGHALYVAIKAFERYDHEHRNQNNTCNDIHGIWEPPPNNNDTKWLVTREEWESQEIELASKPDPFQPVQMVVIQHSVTRDCFDQYDCSVLLRGIQHNFVSTNRTDVPYNFFIDINGLVYEGRGWGKVGRGSGRFDECCISIGFIGDYDKIKVQQIQLDRAKLIIETGVGDHYIDPEHVIVGARDITETTSPGHALYVAIKAFERYDHEHRNQNNTCNDIHGIWEPPPNNNDTKWLVTREEWESQEIELASKPDPFQPVQMVVIQHSVTRDCFDQYDCSELLRGIQYYYVTTNRTDVPYNFLIDINGLVYEGRGWGKVGSNSGRFDECCISIGFIGDYDKIKVQQIQLDRAKLIIETGIRDHYIDPEHVIVGAKDITATTSPGQSLYDAIRAFDRYDHENRHQNSTCYDIHDVDLPDGVPDWFVTREEWGSHPYRANRTDPKYRPAKLVVINNSITTVCYRFETCVAELRQLQYWIMQNTGSDVPYNFAIGNDGRVYEMRGWGYRSGAVNRAVHHCEINIGFIGEYVTGSLHEAHLTREQVNRTMMLLDEGLRLGYLDENFVVLGARDLMSTSSPAEDLYNEIQTWDRYDHECSLCERDCDGIHGVVASDDGEKRRS